MKDIWIWRACCSRMTLLGQTWKDDQKLIASIMNPKCTTRVPKTTSRRMVEDQRRAAGRQLWMTVRALAANQSGWKDNVKALCALWHKDYRDRDWSLCFPCLSCCFGFHRNKLRHLLFLSSILAANKRILRIFIITKMTIKRSQCAVLEGSQTHFRMLLRKWNVTSGDWRHHILSWPENHLPTWKIW